MKNHLFACIAALTLAGCETSRWAKQGATEADFFRDRYACEQQAASMYPPAPRQQMTSPGFQAPAQPVATECVNVGGVIRCRSGPQGGVSASIYNQAPTYQTVDANQAQRAHAVRSCLLSNGYRITTQ